MQSDEFCFQEWQPNYTVGNTLIDAQHKKLLSLCGQVINLVNQENQGSLLPLQNLLAELWANIKIHFRTEEAMLTKCDYSLLKEHVQEHRTFEQVFSGFLSSVASGEYNKQLIITYLSEWWTEHILCSDKQYSMAIRLWKD